MECDLISNRHDLIVVLSNRYSAWWPCDLYTPDRVHRVANSTSRPAHESLNQARACQPQRPYAVSLHDQPSNEIAPHQTVFMYMPNAIGNSSIKIPGYRGLENK